MVTLKKIEARLHFEACLARAHEYEITREVIERFLKETKVSRKNINIEKDCVLFQWKSDVRLPTSGAVQEVQLHDGWRATRIALSWIIRSKDRKIEFRVWDSDQSMGTLTVYEEV